MPEWDENGRPIQQEWDEQGRPIRRAPPSRPAPRARPMTMEAAWEYVREQRAKPKPAPRPTTRPGTPDRRAPGGLRRLITGQVSTGEDVARSGVSGVAEGLMGMAETVAGPALGLVRKGREQTGGLDVGPLDGLIDTVTDPISGVRWTPQTNAGEWARTAGSMLPNAAIPGSILARAAAVALPTIGARGAGDSVEALGGDENAQAIAELVGGLAGGVASGLRRPGTPRPAPRGLREMSPDNRGIRMATRGLTPQKLEEAANRLRAAGANPALVDVTDDAGRAVIRAGAERGPARQVAEDFADARVTGLPDRMSAAARRIVSDDTRPPAQVVDDLKAARGKLAETNYADAYATVVSRPRNLEGANPVHELPPAVRSVLEDSDGASAVARALKAARANQDAPLVAQLEALRQGDASVPITARALDRIRMAFREMSQNAAVAQRGSLARGYAMRVDRLDSILDDVDALVPARTAYRNASAEIDAAKLAEKFTRADADGLDAALARLPDGPTPALRAIAARAIERAAGENIGAAPGVARRIALAPEQQARNRALLGEDDARRLQDAMRAEERLTANASYIAPGRGSQTFNRGQSAADVAGGVAEAGLNVATGGKLGLLRAGLTALRSRGLSDNDALLLVQASTDPARLNAIIADMARRNPQLAVDARLMLARAGLIGGATAGTQERPGPPRR